MTDNIVYGIGFGGRRERETRELIAEAKTGEPIYPDEGEGYIKPSTVLWLHDNEIQPPYDCA